MRVRVKRGQEWQHLEQERSTRSDLLFRLDMAVAFPLACLQPIQYVVRIVTWAKVRLASEEPASSEFLDSSLCYFEDEDS